MDYKIIIREAFTVVGIAVRTTNENDKAMKDIPELWQKFRSNNISEKILDKGDDEVIGLYTEYESDFTKPYTFIIGCSVKSPEANVPEGYVRKNIPERTYAKFTTQGKFPESLLQIWKYVWSSDLKRTYTADFEVYGKDFDTTQTVDVYIAIETH